MDQRGSVNPLALKKSVQTPPNHTTEHVPGTERRPLLVHPPDDSCIARDLHALRPSPDSFHLGPPIFFNLKFTHFSSFFFLLSFPDTLFSPWPKKQQPKDMPN